MPIDLVSRRQGRVCGGWFTAAYVLALCTLLLWPWRFSAPVTEVPNGAGWLAGEGLVFASPGIWTMAGTGPLVDRMRNASGLTVEVWAASSRAHQLGPARLFTISTGPYARNLMLGQSGGDAVFRLRTTATDLDGSSLTSGTMDGRTAEMIVPGAFVGNGLQHIVITDDFTTRTAFVNGVPRVETASPGGSLSNWEALPLQIGNEGSGTRPWLGHIARIAMLDRILTDAHVRARFADGPGAEPSADAVFDLPLAGTSSPDPTLDRPDGLVRRLDPPQLIPFAEIAAALPRVTPGLLADPIANILLFLPLGFLGARSWPAARVATFCLSGAAFSLSMETAQIFLDLRHASATDVAANTIGAGLGAAAARYRPGRRQIRRIGEIRNRLPTCAGTHPHAQRSFGLNPTEKEKASSHSVKSSAHVTHTSE